jgi:ribonucleotide monophosphatase NagD (HAD superfamily)
MIILHADVAMLVEKLAATGAKIVIISNSSRRAVVTYDKLKTLGFDPSLFLGAVTSGELTHQYLLRYRFFVP